MRVFNRVWICVHSNSSTCERTFLQWGERLGAINSAKDLNLLVPIKNLGEFRWYAGCRFYRDSGCWHFDDLAVSFP